jgi:hypothetical protein
MLTNNRVFLGVLRYGAVLGTIGIISLLASISAHAAAGTNQTMNFQGRLMNSQGATVPDGNYNIQFKIYQDGDGLSAGDTTGSPAGSLKWTENYLNANSQGVTVKNGYMSVDLGSLTPFGASVNWNQDTLWLSMNIGGTTSCTPFSSCSPDGEMVPMKRLSSTPYSINSAQLGGLTSAQFLQLAQGVQTDVSTNTNSIFINKTGTGNFLDLQANGSDAFVLANSGDITLGAASAHTVLVATAAAGTAGQVLTIAAGNAGTSASAINGGTLVLQGGTGSGGGSSGSVVVKSNGTNSTTALQVQNASGNTFVAVDTTTATGPNAKGLVVGSSNAVDGAVTFKNSASSNSITLNSTGANASYNLTLPSAAPAGGLCVETSPGNAYQLIFASCTNNNASIQQVREWDANNTNSLTISPSTVGDEVVLTTQIPTSGVTVTGITGGGVTSWNKAAVSAGNGTVNRVEMWVGTVAGTGSSAITVNYSSSPGAEEITASEFTASGVNASTSWGIETAGSQLNTTSSTNVTFPSATAVNGSELYVGYAQVQNPPASAGASTGFNYVTTSTQHNVITYNTALSANTAYQPTAIQNTAGQSNAVSVVLTAFVSSSSINNATSLQKANYYVQAASTGSVAAILQAASSGTSDVFEVRDSSAANVLTVGSTGNMTLKPAASTAALQIQNSTGNNIVAVDTTTSGKGLVLGSSNAIGGMLSFSNVTNTNSISLAAPSSVAASYTLTLPTNTPTAGLCLGTSPDPNQVGQLIFASCATQVSAASISQVNRWSNSGTSITTLADAPASNGNLIVLYSHATNGVTISNITGGGVTNWTKVTSNSASGTGQGNNEMWRGVVTSAGSGTITVTYSGAAGNNEIVGQEFTIGSTGGTWAVDTSGTAINAGAQTTINYPSLTAASSSELYAGYAWSQNAMSAGTTTGFTYASTVGGKFLAYNTNVTNGVATQPTATQSTAGNYNSIAAFIAAYAGTSVIVNSTATQQANFNIQAATSGTVAGVLQAANGSTADIFEAKDGNGKNVATISSVVGNPTSSGLTLGSSNAIGGQINFSSSSNSNIISILAPTAPGASYQLILPTTTPAAGQCLASSPNNSSQLVFSSCANQVTSVAITFVNNWKAPGSGNALTLNVSPVSIGDLMILFVAPQKGNTVNSVSGGGVTSWSKITSTINGTGMEMWRGVVTSTGAKTVSVSLSGAAGNNELAASEFTTGSTTGSWVVDTSNTLYNSTASTTVTYPNLTPQSTKDLYVGYATSSSTMSAGSTAGFTYLTGGQTNTQGLYNTSVSAGIQPTATQSSSGTSVTAAALVAAYSSSSVISNSTVTQQANFNIQAATSDSVAGVLQAANGGTADVMDILDVSGTVVGSFGNTGNLLVKPSTASAAALQVQTTTGVNVLSADTSSKLVVVGAGSTGESSPTLLVVDNETGTTADPTSMNGAIYYNATTRSFRCGVADSWQNCNSLLYSNTSASAANGNCSGNCTAFSTATAIPANYCQAGRAIRLFAAGYFSSQASTSNLRFGVYYGTDSTTAVNDVLLGSLTPAASVTSANNNYFQLDMHITCFSTSAMQSNGTVGIQNGSSSAGLLTLPMGATNGTTVVTSSTKNLYIFPIWDVANASNTAMLSQLTVNAY